MKVLTKRLCLAALGVGAALLLAGCGGVRKSTVPLATVLETQRCTRQADTLLVMLPGVHSTCLLYTSPSPRDKRQSRMPSSA